MEIEIDYCPTSEREHYFVSVGLNENEAISFDHTLKGCRIIKQILIKDKLKKKIVNKNKLITGRWKTLVINNGKFVKSYNVLGIDYDNLDIINGEIWETIWEKLIDDNLDKKLLYYSRLICDNYLNLDKFSDEIIKFEKILYNEIKNLK